MTPLRSIVPLPLVLPILVGGVLLWSSTALTTELRYERDAVVATSSSTGVADNARSSQEPAFIVTHLPTPEFVKAIYMTSCIASAPKLRAPLITLIEETALNAVVIDIKDYTGMISFDAEDDRFVLNTKGCFVRDMKEFIGELHEKGIYVIGRVTVMQDTIYPTMHPAAAVKRKSDGGIWKDKKGLTFIDPGATEYWEYMVDLGKASWAVGFDEINYDYIRFPSDGNMIDIAFLRTGSTTKSEMMRRFYNYLGAELKKVGIPSSADLFGMTTTNTDDLGIGQILEHALVAFDYVAPMVYPSHYPPGFNGWRNPNDVPGPIVAFSMERAIERARALEAKEAGCSWPPLTDTAVVGTSTSATSTRTLSERCVSWKPSDVYVKRLRPWLQDFDYGGNYDEAEVRAQIAAVENAGLRSWMVWDPSNRYTPSAYDKE